MRIGRVFGRVTLSRSHPSMAGASLRLAAPMDSNELAAEQPAGEAIVVWDSLGAGDGSLVAISEGGEAAQPFQPELKPVDAYVSALIDHLDVDEG